MPFASSAPRHPARDAVRKRELCALPHGRRREISTLSHVVARTLHDVKKSLVGAQCEAISKSKWPRKNFGPAILADPVHPSIYLVEIAGVGRIQITFRIEDRKIRRPEFPIADAFPGLQHSALAVDAHQCGDPHRRPALRDDPARRRRSGSVQEESGRALFVRQARVYTVAKSLSIGKTAGKEMAAGTAAVMTYATRTV